MGINRADVLQQASDLIAGPRAAQYGDASDTHQRIIDMFVALYDGLDRNFEPQDAVVFHIITKLVRATRTPTKADSWIDIAGYAALAAEMAGAE